MKHGDPTLGGAPRSKETDPYRKVMERVEIPADATACWVWSGSQETFGHGNTKIGGKNQKVHRIVYQHHNGEIPVSVLVRHTCDNPPCVNPEHLIAGTYADNSGDMAERLRSPHGVNHVASRLTADMVRSIRAKWVEGCPYNDLAAEYGVSRTTIVSLVKGKTYRHV